MEKTLVLIKPDAIQRDLVGAVITRLEKKGLQLVGMKMMYLSDDLILAHYDHLKKMAFFNDLKRFMQKTPIVACCWKGVDCVNIVRKIVGATNAREADLGSIRGDFAMSIQTNLVHASDSLETADVEIKRFFSELEIYEYDDVLEEFSYTQEEREV